MATNKIKLVVKPTRSIPMVVKPVPKIGLMSMAPTKGDPGVGIESLEQTTKSTESGGTNVWTATLTDGTVHDFEVMNGDPGEGIATGGTPGQALVKASTTDYATRWMSILPEDTASGAVASFSDGSDDLPMGVVVDIDPVQDLHGYDNPWPGGGGKNLAYIFNDGKVPSVSNGELVTADGTRTDFIKITPGQTYTFSFTGSFVRIYVFFYDANKTFIRYASYNAASYSFTPQTNEEYGMLRLDTATPDSFVFQLESGSTATSYAPYSNICPVSGRTGAKVTRTGVNVWDEEYVTTGYFEADGTWRSANYLSSKNPIPVKPNTSYYLYMGTGAAFVTFWSKEVPSGASAAQYIISRVRAENRVITTPSNCVAMHFNTTDYGTAYNNNISVNYPSTAHAYEPYTAVTHEIPFSTEVYGGKLNVTEGKMRITYAMVDMGTLPWQIRESLGGFSATVIPTPKNQFKAISSCYPYKGVYSSVTDKAFGYVYNNHVFIKDSAYSDAESLKTSLNGQTLVYELATPIEVTLTPEEIRSLLGDNNVWADTGDVSVIYKANIQKYIDKKISAAVAAMS